MTTTIEDIENKFSYIPQMFKRNSKIRNQNDLTFKGDSNSAKEILYADWLRFKHIPQIFEKK